MAFNATNFHKVIGGNINMFFYKTTDAISTVDDSGYFNSVADNLRQYDIIVVISETGGTPGIDLIFVTSADLAATVTTSAAEKSAV